MPQISEVTLTASATATNAAVTATLPAPPATTNETLWLTEAVFTLAAGATPQTPVTATITGLVGGTFNFALAAPANTADDLVVPFTPPVRASAPNTAIVATIPATLAAVVGAIVLTGYAN